MTAPEPGALLAGRYRLERPLAQGGMGAVWSAFDTQLEVRVAAKFMDARLAASPDLVARFEREAKAAAQIRGPHVVQVFEHGIDAGTPYIVMELLEGEDLGARLRQRGRVTLWEAADILAQVCKALRRAHDAGIVHRDLKPANILLARHDEDESVKVLDFGIAKSPEAAKRGEGTRTGVVMGSPAYMSPEQVRSTKGVDHRSDLWSLGLVLFRMVTGRQAFTGETDADIIIRMCSDPVPVPSQIAPDLPPEVDAFFARALSRSLDGRFQSAREMAAAFGAIVGRVPSIAVDEGSSAAVPPPAPVMRTVELLASDVAKTVPLAAPVQQGEKTELLPVMTGDSPVVPGAAPSGSTLTGTGVVALAPRARRPGRAAWTVAACAAIMAIGAVVAFLTYGARGGPTSSLRPSPGEPPPPAASTSVPAPAASEASAATSAALPVERASATEEPPPPPATTAPRVAAPRPRPKPAVTSAPAPTEGLPDIPRVLNKNQK